MAFDVGSLVGKLKLDDKQFTSGIAKAKSKLKTVDDGFVSLQRRGLKTFRGITREVFSLRSAFLGLGVGLVAKSFLNVASSVEVFETQLTTTLGSLEEAQERMVWIENFAKTTPFEMPQLVEASVRLEAYGIDATKVMRTLGDTASAMGKDVIMAVEALADAQTGEFERLKEFGLKVVKEGGQDMILFTDKNGKQQKRIIDRNNREITTSTIMAIWNEKYQGGMERMSKTWSGMISNLKDFWFGFRKDIMNSGVFEFLKVGLRVVLDAIIKLEKSGRLKEWAINTGKVIVDTFVAVGKIVVKFPELWVEMVGGIKKALGFLVSAIDTLFLGPMEAMVAVWNKLPFVDEIDLAGLKGIRSAMQDTALDFLTQGMLLDQAGENWEKFGQRVGVTLDIIRSNVTAGITPEVLKTDEGPLTQDGGGGLTEQDIIDRQIAQQEMLRNATENAENARRRATIAASNAIIASRKKEIAFNKLFVSGIQTGLDYLVQAFPKLKGLAIGRATMNFGVALSEALKVPFPASLAAWTKVAALGKTAIDAVKGARPGGGSTPSVSQTPIATVPQGVPEAAGIDGGGQRIFVTINALDPESVTEATAVRVVQVGMPEAFKAGGGTFNDVTIQGEER